MPRAGSNPLNLHVHAAGKPHRSFDGGRASDYRPLEVVHAFALRALRVPRTWEDLLAYSDKRGLSWWREQVFALDWLGLAAWTDAPPEVGDHKRLKNPRGTWMLTALGKERLLALS